MSAASQSRQSLKRLGGELPLLSDRITSQTAWSSRWLAFSHGRGALSWLIKRQRIESALVCAYTCPSVPEFLRHARIGTAFFDVGASPDEIRMIAGRLRGRTLVLLPSLFGSPPWLSPNRLAASLGASVHVVIDAAQTAFGHRDFRPPANGATLSCPRKTTALADGAVLALGRGIVSGRLTDGSPGAVEAAALKQAARALWATGSIEHEAQAVGLNRASELAWPDGIFRMTDQSRALLRHIDAAAHRLARRRNHRALRAALGGALPCWKTDDGTPFSLPVFVDDPDALVASLHRERIFVSRLWPDAHHDARRHPAAAYLVRHLVSLPVDQRHDADDIARIARAVRRARPRPATAPPPALAAMIEM